MNKIVATRAMSNTTINLSDSQIQDIVSYVNKYRAINQAPPMIYDKTISTFSQSWSNYLLANNKFQHSGSSIYGENLAWFQGYGTDPVTLVKLSIDMWYDEIKQYDFNHPGFSEATGHFTCLVWKSSSSFGLGIAINGNNGGTADITMNTSPPGNVDGQYQDNVLPIVTTIPSPVVNPIPTPIIVPTPITPPPIIVPTPQTTDENVVNDILIVYQILQSVNNNASRSTIISMLKNLIRTMNNQLT